MKSSKISSVKISADEREHCRNVIEEATPRALDVLQAFTNSLNYKQVALLLNITEKTVEMYALILRDLCRTEWGLPPDKKFPNCFLHATFAAFFQHEMKNTE
jgi:FixJ family two-component response regulator